MRFLPLRSLEGCQLPLIKHELLFPTTYLALGLEWFLEVIFVVQLGEETVEMHRLVTCFLPAREDLGGSCEEHWKMPKRASHVTHICWTCDWSWPLSPLWPQGLGQGWRMAWARPLSVRSGTWAGRLGKTIPFLLGLLNWGYLGLKLLHLVKSRVQRRVETDS